jgi:Mg-chelatase subunit ChlD
MNRTTTQGISVVGAGLHPNAQLTSIGRPQQLRRTGGSRVTGQLEDLFVVGDISPSMEEELDPGVTKFESAIRAGVSLILGKCQVDSRDRVGIIPFDEGAEIAHPLSEVGTDKASLIQTLQSLTIGNGTDLNAGLVEADGAFDWNLQNVVRRIVLLTDGHGGSPEQTAASLRQRGVVLDVIGFGHDPSDVNEELLRSIATPSHYRFIKDHRTLVQHYTQLANKTQVGR